MILNNYRLWRAYTMGHSLGKGNQSPNPNFTDIGIVTTNGQRYSLAISTFFGQAVYNFHLNGLTSFVGDGTTTPTELDYHMESDKTSSFSNIERTFNIAADNGKWKFVHTLSGVNTSNHAVTISEIGIGVKLAANNGATAGMHDYLFVHSLLEQPIVVPAGKGFTLTFEWVES